MKKRFKRVYIEITNVCNKSCTFCPKTGRRPRAMTTEEFTGVLEQVAPYTDYVYFHVMGEPLSHGNLAEFLNICEKHRLKVNLTTNGTLLAEKIDILKNAAALRKVAVSLHSFQAENISQMKGYLDACVQSVKSLAEKTLCEFRLWNVSEDTGALNSDIIHYLKGCFSAPLTVQNGKGTVLAKNVYLALAEQFDWPDKTGNFYGEAGSCQALKTQIAVLSDGTVVPCCLDNDGQIALGNIYGQALSDILSGDRAVNIINGFKNRKRAETLCKHCGYSQRFQKGSV